jgi:CubicO group peptidase (beta-lactamase class C family)
MLVNQITPDVDRKAWFYGPAGGFGLGFGLLPIDMKDPSKGEYFSWSGYAGTNMWVDPKNDITTVFMIQNNELAGAFDQRSWVYGSYASPAAPPTPSIPAPAAPAQ